MIKKKNECKDEEKEEIFDTKGVLPLIDEILGQGNWFTVSADGDCSVQVSWGVSILAIWYTDHCAADLSENNL